MYDIDDYSERDLKIINHRLNLSVSLLANRGSLEDLRAEAAAGHGLEHVKVFDEFGMVHNRDLRAVRHIRHQYTNYESYWRWEESDHVRRILWVIGFAKTSGMLRKAYPELVAAVDYEFLNRVTFDDRLLLRDIIFRLLDMTTIQVPDIPMSVLHTKAVESLNRALARDHPDVQPVTADSRDALDQQSIKKQILLDYISERLTDEPKRLGLTLLDGYNRALARERLYGKALDAFSGKYPGLQEVCDKRMELYRETTALNLDWSFYVSDLTLGAPDLKDIYKHVIKKYSDGSMSQTISGLRPDLRLEDAPPALANMIRSLAVETILNNFSSYPQHMARAVLMPEPQSSSQQANIRMLSLGRVQEHYPELSEVIQAELRLLPSMPEAAIAT